MTLEYYF